MWMPVVVVEMLIVIQRAEVCEIHAFLLFLLRSR